MHPRDVLLWITLTPPGAQLFGTPSHRQTIDEGGKRSAPCRCKRDHGPGDPLIGVPLNPDRFEYARAAAWNENVSKLWSKSVIELRAWLCVPRSRYQDIAYLRVVEWQQRGLAHVHALVRIRRQPGRRITKRGVARQLARTSLEVPINGAAVILRWGAQLDVQILGSIEDDAVLQRASYIAKYATKSPGDSLAGSDARTRHHARIANAVQERLSQQMSHRRLLSVRERLGLRGSIVTASHSWEPRRPREPADLPRVRPGGRWRLASTGYELPPPSSVQMPETAYVPFAWRCERAGVRLRDANLDAADIL